MMTLFFNGDVLTMENESDCPEAVLIDEDHIVATGSYDDLLALAGAHCQLVDLMGHTLMPSFIDAHSHISGYAFSLMQASVEVALRHPEIGKDFRAYLKELCKTL